MKIKQITQYSSGLDVTQSPNVEAYGSKLGVLVHFFTGPDSGGPLLPDFSATPEQARQLAVELIKAATEAEAAHACGRDLEQVENANGVVICRGDYVRDPLDGRLRRVQRIGQGREPDATLWMYDGGVIGANELNKDDVYITPEEASSNV